MADAQEVSPATLAVLGLAGITVAAILFWFGSVVARVVSSLVGSSRSRSAAKGAKAAKPAPKQPAPSKPSGPKQPDLKTLIKQSKDAKRIAATKEDMAAHHRLFINTLKGHPDVVHGVAWSPDGRRLATACDDMQLRVFDLSQPSSQNPKFRSVQTQPHAPIGVGFGNDGDSLVAALRGIPDVVLSLYSPHKGPRDAVSWSPAWERKGALGREQLLDMAVVPAAQSEALGGPGGGVAVLLSQKKQGAVFGTATGRELAEFKPNSFANHALAVSANGRFVAVASFTADVMVWEVQWGRDGYKGTPKVMDLKGHNSQVMSAAFSPDGSRAVTASKDGTMRVWNTAVRYQLQEDPKTLLKLDLPLPEGQVFDRMAWGPDGTIAAAVGTHVHFVDSSSGKVLEVLHAHDGPITCMTWCPRPLQLPGAEEPVAVLATSSSDRRVRIWRSPRGLAPQ